MLNYVNSPTHRTYLQTAIQKDKMLIPAYYGLAEVYVQQRQFTEAIAVYQQLTEVNPNDAKSWVRLGVLYINQQQITDAITTFRQAIAVDENSADAHNNLAWLYANQGKELARAVELAERAVAFRRGTPPAWIPSPSSIIVTVPIQRRNRLSYARLPWNRITPLTRPV